MNEMLVDFITFTRIVIAFPHRIQHQHVIIYLYVVLKLCCVSKQFIDWCFLDTLIKAYKSKYSDNQICGFASSILS